MYLKHLELRGFKSFVDARLTFQPGITAVVGPNGTGKSNILDAVLWVLGEQSTKTLRSERMEDVIFNGTESRQPLGMVEVSLILGDVDSKPANGNGNGNGNGDGDGETAALPHALGECEEVMVTRRLFRDGVSEYFINKTPCRLKDLRALLLDTRAGSKGHTVIEQGRIDRVLKATPIERRELIEETAGIVRYKKQKAEALRKLESTSQNLLRVRDIVNEVKRQLGSLERQARAAEQYQKLRQEVRRLELTVLVHDYRELLHEREDSDRALGDLTLRESAEAAAIARLSAEVEALHLEVTEGDAVLTTLRDEVAQSEKRLAQAGADITLLAQRSVHLGEQRALVQADIEHVRAEQKDAEELLARLRSRIEQVIGEFSVRSAAVAESEAGLAEALRRHRGNQAELDAARALVMERMMAAAAATNRLAANEARAVELRRRIAGVEQERLQAVAAGESSGTLLSACTERRRRIETDLVTARGARTDLADAVVCLKNQLAEAGQRVARMQEEKAVAEARQKVLQSVTCDTAMRDSDDTTLKDTVAQVLSVPSRLERAVEAALGHRLMGRLVEGPSEAVGVLRALALKGASGGTFIPRHPRIFGSHVTATLDGAGVVGPAHALVTPRQGYEELVAHLLAGVVIVETLEQAAGLWQQMTADRQALLVTLAGEIVAPDGIVSGSLVGMVAGAMGRERELQAVAVRMAELGAELRDELGTRTGLEGTVASEAARLEALEGEIRNLEMGLVGERKDEQRAEQDLGRWSQSTESFLAERAAAETELAGLPGAEQAAREDLLRCERERAEAEQSVPICQGAVAVSQAEVERRQAALLGVRTEAAALQDRLEQARSELARVEAASALREVRIGELDTETLRLKAAGMAAETERRQVEESVPAVEVAKTEAGRRLIDAQELQTGRVAKVRAQDADLNRLRHALGELHRQQEDFRQRRLVAQTRLEGFDAQLTGTYAVSFDGALTEIGEGNGADMEGIREALAQKRGRLSELGPVNVMAIDEHRELEERLRFLTTQEEDLTQSIASLKAIIARINRTTKQLFLETFQDLQTKFNETFRTFFDGGHAELVLVEDEESTEPGVDIVAQPPGKRLKNISMLSGGERALTAMALIFASFLIRPTPFCVLDEIDAPLDEENTIRFARVLRDLSARTQFIIMTHSKSTMEMADALYGVTMEEAGVSSLVSVRLNRLLAPA
jgi:chromosome segregation protein